LKWSKEQDLYLMSGLSSLALGPMATNILGGRIAASRIAGKLWDQSETPVEIRKKPSHRPNLTSLAKIAANMDNYWSALVDVGSE
jgi:hypothetical protein